MPELCAGCLLELAASAQSQQQLPLEARRARAKRERDAMERRLQEGSTALRNRDPA